MIAAIEMLLKAKGSWLVYVGEGNGTIYMQGLSPKEAEGVIGWLGDQCDTKYQQEADLDYINNQQ